MLARSHGFPQESLKHFMNDIVFYYVYDMIFFDNLPNDFFFFSFLRFVFIFVGSASFGCGQFHGQTGHKWTDPRDGQQLYCNSHHAIPEHWRRSCGIWHTKSGQSLLSYQVSYIYTRKQNVYGVSKRTSEQAIHSYILGTLRLFSSSPLLDRASLLLLSFMFSIINSTLRRDFATASLLAQCTL